MNNTYRFQSFFLLVILLLSLLSNLNAQNITKQLRIMRGGNIPFVFSTLNDYNNGKSLGDTVSVTTGWTRLQISFTDTTDTGGDGLSNGWELLVNATTPFISDVGNNELTLDSLKVFSKSGIFTNSIVTTYNHTLSLGQKIIASGTDPFDKTAKGEIELSFYLFMKRGKKPDYYNTELSFILKEK